MGKQRASALGLLATHTTLEGKLYIVEPERPSLDRFTERIRKVLRLAQEEAQRMQHNYIGSEHILLGLICAGEGVGARVLQQLGVQLAAVRVLVDELGNVGEDRQLGMIVLTTNGSRVIKQAADEARQQNHYYVDTEHLVLAMFNVPKSTAAQVLTRMGLDANRVRVHILELLQSTSSVSWQRSASFATLPLSERPRPPMQYSADRERFAKFNERARKVLSLAQEEAQRFQHNYLGTEHILLGLVREGEGVAAQVLSSLDVELAKVRSALEFVIGRGDRIVLGEVGLTPRAKKVVELAVDEARRLNHPMIGTEHLLLGLIREGGGIAAGVLETLGVNLEKVRIEVVRVLSRHSSDISKEPVQGLLLFASAYVRGTKQIEQNALLGQDADDLVPVPTSEAERGNRLTLRVRRVLLHAREEAQQQQSSVVGTQHLLLALLREQNGIAFHVLNHLGIVPEHIKSITEFLHVHEQFSEPGEVDGFTTDAKQALELAISEADQLGHTSLGTEHVLLGLLQGTGMAAGVLMTYRLRLDHARIETRRLLSL